MRTNTTTEIDALDFLRNIASPEDLKYFNSEKLITKIQLHLQENLNVITLATCVIREKTCILRDQFFSIL